METDNAPKELFKDSIAAIVDNPSIGEMKQADLSGIQCVDIYHNKTNYEIAYR